MDAIRFLAITVLIALLAFSCSADDISEVQGPEVHLKVAPPAKQIEIKILELINEHRTSKGLKFLKGHNVIKSVAYSHTNYMVTSGKVNHDNFPQRKVYLTTYADASKVTENVAYGYSSAEAVVKAWLKSDAHRKNLEGDYTNFDISAEKDLKGRWYFTNIFINR